MLLFFLYIVLEKSVSIFSEYYLIKQLENKWKKKRSEKDMVSTLIKSET